MIKCSECGANISTSATSCPQCGKVRKKKGGCGKTTLTILGIIILIGVIGAIATPDRSSSGSSSSSNSNVSASASNSSQPEWWEVDGTLRNASALEWQNASYANKLATCGDLMVISWENGVLCERISRDFESRNMDRVRFWADSLVIVLDIAMERFPDPDENERVYANQTVAEIAAFVFMMSDWMK